MNRILFASLFAATSAIAGPYDQAYSIITTDAARSADPHVIPVLVNRVDGATVPRHNRAVVPPGAHRVTIDVAPRKGFRLATQHTFDLVTQPCVRYYVAAKLDTLVTQGWTPIVRSEERIGECEKKFK